ncbi:MAG: lipase maturation factor family protein [Polyangiaceae bacterium]|nr:lipase maturation factor family protein [Polyangiaceae bacterium]
MWARISEVWKKTELGAREQTLTIWVFLRCLGLVYLVAFWSLGTQVLGLVGENGLLPAGAFLRRVAQSAGASAYWQVPTLCWLSSSDTTLILLCVAGAAFALALMAGVVPRLCLFACYVMYLSLASVCQDFLWFQWDSLLLEASFLSVFLAPMCVRQSLTALRPPPVVGLYLLRWLIFRLMLASAAVKLTSGDPAWRDLTALTFHYETQPLPSWTAWYAHLLPLGFQKASALGMFAIEGPCAFLVFAPRRLRIAGALAFIFLQLLILGTGSYGFFNLLTIVLCIPLFDDRCWPRWLQQRAQSSTQSQETVEGPSFSGRRRFASLGAACILVWLSLVPLCGALHCSTEWLGPAAPAVQELAPFRLINHYGLFAVMTTERQELVSSHPETARARK